MFCVADASVEIALCHNVAMPDEVTLAHNETSTVACSECEVVNLVVELLRQYLQATAQGDAICCHGVLVREVRLGGTVLAMVMLYVRLPERNVVVKDVLARNEARAEVYQSGGL